ncbi:ribosomal-protein-alanine N-acetyltransferase [Tamaricihabitans halophyticus]|uniref:Ribosomal-protein-alanine N-acetyltransferase n=1 Tax=Tamaricihabitans halophyticus TaxID=1262583 RepID=A0A4R2QTJ6_9PSEU|nr:ribosomal protein S18-alanine N-acetyltransferase [Tamaricihabitans halophyticus]TCP53262.1 ribosomal-protein-alanine N-acetyltransferase [Tamaricihabitans halophyticus]
MTVSIGPLRYRDAQHCARLERQLFAADDPWSARAFESELDSGAYYLGAYHDGALVGYGGLALLGKSGDYEAEVHTIGVDPRWQGHGVGKLLLRGLLEHADAHGATVFLEVRTDNETAIGLYTAHGFSKIGVRRRYYRPSGADAYTMSRPAAVEEGPK